MSRNGPSGQAASRMPLRRPSAEHDPYGAQAPQHPQQQPAGYWGQQAPDYGQQQPQGGYAGSGYGQQAAYGQQPPYAEPGYSGYAQQQPSYPQQTPRSNSPYGQPQDYARDLDAQPRGFAPQAPAQPMPFDRFPATTPGYTSPAAQPSGWPLSAQPQQGQYAPQHAEPPFQVGPNDHFNQPVQEYGEAEDQYEDGALGDEEEEPRSGRRTLMIVAALVGAIGIGGAMAYTYKTVFGGRSSALKADSGPVKAKPDTTTPKDVANLEKKLPNRLDGAAPGAESDDSQKDPSAPNRVRLIPITPGGQPTAQPAATPPSAAPSIPGIMLDMGPSPQRPQPPPNARSPVQAAAPQPAATPPAAAPTRPAAAPVRTIMVNPTSPEPAAATPPPAAKKTVKAPVAKANASPDGPTASLATPPTGAGYVAVLASQKTRMDALKMFADLQQKYGDVLGTKTPDVQEANLGDKGMWYRAVVGPPGSRDGASSLCSQLKSAGYNGCWVTAY